METTISLNLFSMIDFLNEWKREKETKALEEKKIFIYYKKKALKF